MASKIITYNELEKEIIRVGEMRPLGKMSEIAFALIRKYSTDKDILAILDTVGTDLKMIATKKIPNIAKIAPLGSHGEGPREAALGTIELSTEAFQSNRMGDTAFQLFLKIIDQAQTSHCTNMNPSWPWWQILSKCGSAPRSERGYNKKVVEAIVNYVILLRAARLAHLIFHEVAHAFANDAYQDVHDRLFIPRWYDEDRRPWIAKKLGYNWPGGMAGMGNWAPETEATLRAVKFIKEMRSGLTNEILKPGNPTRAGWTGQTGLWFRITNQLVFGSNRTLGKQILDKYFKEILRGEEQYFRRSMKGRPESLKLQTPGAFEKYYQRSVHGGIEDQERIKKHWKKKEKEGEYKVKTPLRIKEFLNRLINHELDKTLRERRELPEAEQVEKVGSPTIRIPAKGVGDLDSLMQKFLTTALTGNSSDTDEDQEDLEQAASDEDRTMTRAVMAMGDDIDDVDWSSYEAQKIKDQITKVEPEMYKRLSPYSRELLKRISAKNVHQPTKKKIDTEAFHVRHMDNWCADLSHLESLYGADTNERLFPLIWKSREISKPTGNQAFGTTSGKPDGGLSWYSSQDAYLNCLGERLAPDLDISEFKKNLLSDVKTGVIKPVRGLDVVHHENQAAQRWRLKR